MATDSSVHITSPVNGEIYMMDSKNSNYEVKLDASSNIPITEITWYIDGREYDKVGPPYQTNWRLSKGTHTITAVGPGHSGDSVEVEMR